MTYLYDTEIEKIKETCSEKLSEDELKQIKFNLSIDKDNKRIINTKHTNEESKEVHLQCKMNWYWNDNYIWLIK